MLPNHAPLVVAEQFALLEAAYPGRIDLGIGRAPGTDPVTRARCGTARGESSDDAVARFPEYVDNVLAMMEPDGVGLERRRRAPTPLRATPRATVGAAGLAARVLRLLRPPRGREGAALRLRPPLLRQRHRRGARALPLARSGPSARAGRAAHLPDRQRRRRGDRRRRPSGSRCRSCWRWSRCAPAAPLGPQLLVEEAEAARAPEAHAGLIAAMRRRWVIGDARRWPRAARASSPRRTASTR